MRKLTGPTARLDRVRGILDERELDALLVSGPATRRWVSGFVLEPMEAAEAGPSGTLIVTRERQVLLATALHAEQATADCPGWEVVAFTGDIAAGLGALIGTARRVGAETRRVPHAMWLGIEAALPDAELVAIDDALDRVRLVKEASEIAALERACQLTATCFVHLRSTLRVGQTEREVARIIEAWFRTNGADGLAFDSLVLVGARAARPHGRPDEVPIRGDEPLLIDFGCVVDGYHSDMTRTVFFGPPTERQRELYEHVLAAQRRAEEMAQPGVSGTEVHEAAVERLAEAGLADAFLHGLGHGIGLEIHEPPMLKDWRQPLSAGMTITLEPGVYMPGEIGIRIEDDYLLTDAGVRRLTAAPRDLIVI